MFREYVPYVYFIRNRTTNMKYLGVRYAKDCNPEDFWVTYFTSSKLVRNLIKLFGKDDFYIKVIHKFPNDPAKAIIREADYFKFIKTRDDYLNISFSSGIMDLRLNSIAGKVGGLVVKSKSLGIFRSDDERLVWASLGGKAGAKIQIENKIGIHGQTPDERKLLALRGNRKCKELLKGFFSKEVQSELGKKGGIKNKGFKWYNDGVKTYKYTKSQQEEKHFDDFLRETKFSSGRLVFRQNQTLTE